jgi:hydrogenase nickel incorporation protein HypA/HybF
MHELSIAESIVDIVHQYVAPERLCDVRSVSVKVGTFSGVVPDSLEFSYQAINAGTPLERSFLSLERIPFVVLCRNCQWQSESEDGVVLCPKCSSYNTEILSGSELQVKDIELDDVQQEKV